MRDQNEDTDPRETGPDPIVTLALQNLMREMEARVLNIYLTEPQQLPNLKDKLSGVWTQLLAIRTDCGVSCRPPMQCCKDGFCRILCEIGDCGPSKT